MPWLTKAGTWLGNNPVVQFLLAIFLALIGWEVVKRNIEAAGRIDERRRQEAANARELSNAVRTQGQLAQENQDATKRAEQDVAALDRFNTLDELRAGAPKGVAAVVLGDDQGRGG